LRYLCRSLANAGSDQYAALDRSAIGVELNRLDDQGGNCRAYLVITNPDSAEFSGFALDLVVFDRGGTIVRRLAVDIAPVRLAKTSVKVFDIPENRMRCHRQCSRQ
jgi:hypothetical protein